MKAMAEIFRKQSADKAAEFATKAEASTVAEVRESYLEIAAFHSSCAFKWELLAS